MKKIFVRAMPPCTSSQFQSGVKRKRAVSIAVAEKVAYSATTRDHCIRYVAFERIEIARKLNKAPPNPPNTKFSRATAHTRKTTIIQYDIISPLSIDSS